MKACANLAAGAVLVLLLLALWMPWPYGEGKEAAKKTACLSNLKQQATAFLIYQSDFEGHFPGRDRWMDALLPYAKDDWIYHCPEMPKGACGYAFNAVLAGRKAPPKPEETLLVYESVNPIRNASDLGVSVPHPGRHRGASNVAFADSHAQSWPKGVRP